MLPCSLATTTYGAMSFTLFYCPRNSCLSQRSDLLASLFAFTIHKVCTDIGTKRTPKRTWAGLGWAGFCFPLPPFPSRKSNLNLTHKLAQLTPSSNPCGRHGTERIHITQRGLAFTRARGKPETSPLSAWAFLQWRFGESMGGKDGRMID